MEKEIDGYNGSYKIDKQGNVYSYKYRNKKKLKPQRASQSRKGYFQVRLFNKEYPKGRLQYIHRLVYKTFVGEIPKNKEIDHINNDTSDNRLENIQILSRRANTQKYNEKKWGNSVRKRRNEFIELYEKLGTYQEVSNATGITIQRIYRVIKDVIHYRDNKTGKYKTRRYSVDLHDKYTDNNLKPKRKRNEKGRFTK